jgi:alkylation response protein AidB-like acyl-CoA dehydrogenase
MALALTEEQEILQRTAREFVQGKSSLKRIRALRDDPTGAGFSPELWTDMARLGWLGIVMPEEYGGAGLGWTDLMVVLEELGRGLVPEPVVGTLLLGTTTLLLGGSDAQRRTHLPAVVAGERRLAVAYQEPGGRYAHHRVETRAERGRGGWTLTGRKLHVLDGNGADWFVVSARTAGGTRDETGVSLFLIPRGARGIAVEAQRRVDSRGAALLQLEGVDVGADAVVGAEGEGTRLLGRVLDRATIGLCAEMLGGMAACFDMTLAYLKTRKQFGVPIGSFQALKHRAARIFVELELARSIVLAAHRALDDAADDARIARLASAAKARCSDAFVLAGNESVQMHGGIGMTDEHDVGFFLKRARAAEITFGDAAFHRDRVARLDGY